MSCKTEPAIWSRGTGQRIPCFDRYQLIIAGMSNIKEVHGKLRLYVSFLEYGRHVGQLGRRRRAYAPTSNTASQDTMRKSTHGFPLSFPCVMSMGLCLAALRVNLIEFVPNQIESQIEIKFCRFSLIASSPPYGVNLMEFVPNQIDSHIEIIPRSFLIIHCLIRLLVAFNNSITST